MQFEQYERSISEIDHFQRPRPHDHYFAGAAIESAMKKENPKPNIENIMNREIQEEVTNLIACYSKNDGVDTGIMERARKCHGWIFFGCAYVPGF